MSRTLDARLSRMEKTIDGIEGDGQSFENLLCSIRHALLEKLDDPDAVPSERADAIANLTHLDAEVWGFGYGEQKRLNTIDALREGRLTGRVLCRIVDDRKGEGSGPDWLEVAESLGLGVPTFHRSPKLITRAIVCPNNVLHLVRLDAGSAADEPRD